jgi:two-component system, OmpR family, sensor kinase
MRALMETEDTQTPARGARPSLAVAVARLRTLVPGRLRTRIFVWYVGLLAVATVSSILVARQVLLIRTDERIDAALVQEAEELRRLASGRDPDTGTLFRGDAERIFEVFLQRNIPARNEALLTFVDGEPFARSRPAVPYRLDQDAELVERWSRVQETVRDSVGTPAGRVEYLAVPLDGRGDTRGVFVAAIFRDREHADAEAALRAAGAVGLAILLIGSVLAWRLADKVLVPVAAVTRTAQSISGGDLTQRIPVASRDEIGELAATFNRMLDRLEAAFAAQRHFLADAGHELRTPITIVRGHIELLGSDPEERAATTALVLDELDRMQRLVDDLLVLAKAERPDFLRCELVDVAALTEEIKAKAEALAPRSWEVESRGSGRVVADRQRLTQAIVQLCENAVTHTRAGDRIAIGSATNGSLVSFWVQDSGPGVAPDEQDRIFDRFARAGDGRRTQGAGLGLAIVKAIAEAHGGHADVAGRAGEGARFTITLPVEGPPPEREEHA